MNTTTTINRKIVGKSKVEFEHLELKKLEADPRRGEVNTEGFGGPDNFGYTWVDSNEANGPTFDWIDISATGTDTGIHIDDGSAVVPIGFPFSFYGTEYSTVMIGENGQLSFIDYNFSDFANQPIPDALAPNNIIVPFWTIIIHRMVVQFIMKPKGRRRTGS